MKHFRLSEKLLLLCLMLLAVCTGAYAAPDEKGGDGRLGVNITVVDQAGEPLIGATVKILGRKATAGATVGTVTDVNGQASVWVDKGTTLEITYVGMNPASIRITKAGDRTVTLEENASMLDQVVVTGYSKTTQRRTTGSVATVSEEELKGKPLANLDMLLQGKVAGMDVKAVSGRPGEAAKVRIRGTNTITGNADPLWVVDGVPLQKDIPNISSSRVKAGDFNDIFANGISGINPNDIKSITVLKDASAAAIYGSRAAGGVIVVTTKRGQEGKMNVTYSANVSIVTKPSRDANLMNSREKLAWEQELWDEFSADRFARKQRYPVIGVVGQIRSGYGQYAGWSLDQQNAEIERLGQTTTDWFGELFQNSVSNSHYLSLSGGSEKTQYYVSFGYDHNNGLVKRTDYERYSVSSKLDLKPHRKLKIGIQLDMGMQDSNGSAMGLDIFRYAYFANPYEKPYNADGSYAADKTYYSMTNANGAYDISLPEEGFNVMRELNETSSHARNVSASTLVTLSWNIIDHLSFEGLGSYNYTMDTSDNINGTDTYSAWTDRPFEDKFSLSSKRRYGSITQTSSYNTNYTLRGHFHYSNTFGQNHYLSALAGAEIRGNYAKSIYEKRYGYDPVSGNSSIPVFPEGTNVDYASMLTYASIVDGLSGQSRLRDTYASFYFTADYVLMNRYILSLTGRTDGSNNFGSKEQFNPTGSVGLSWNVDQESWMKPLSPILSSLSIRAATGYTGNINKSVLPQLVMTYSNQFRKTDDLFLRVGMIGNAPNPKLRWEKTHDMKVSVDMGFFNDRLRLQGELYSRRTRDAVSSVQVVSTTGFTTQSFNTSELENKGAELSVSGVPYSDRDWRLTIGANIAWNSNKLLKYNPPSVSMFNNNYVGYPLGSIISGKVIGIDEEFGIYTYQVRPDVTMSTIADRQKSQNYAFYLGTENAPVNGGYSISVGYKKVTLSAGGSYSFGGKILNNITAPQSYSSLTSGSSPVQHPATQDNDLYVNYFNVTRDHVNRWTPSNPITNGYPRIIDAYGEYLGLENYMITSSLITRASMLENISYFKLGSLMLSYSLEADWLRKAHINSVLLSASASNIFTITNYKGIDPETPGAVYPMARSYSFGLSVNF